MDETVVDYLELYEDLGGDWRWRAKSNNGDIVADSSEGYERRNSAKDVAQQIFPGTPVKPDDFTEE